MMLLSQRGRPKKMRRKDTNEEPISGKKLKRQLAEWTCSRCGLKGHNKRGCKNVVVNEQDEPAPAPAPAVINQHVVHEEINLSQPPSSQDTNLDLFLV